MVVVVDTQGRSPTPPARSHTCRCSARYPAKAKGGTRQWWVRPSNNTNKDRREVEKSVDWRGKPFSAPTNLASNSVGELICLLLYQQRTFV